jgi:hypothetical protein
MACAVFDRTDRGAPLAPPPGRAWSYIGLVRCAGLSDPIAIGLLRIASAPGSEGGFLVDWNIETTPGVELIERSRRLEVLLDALRAGTVPASAWRDYRWLMRNPVNLPPSAPVARMTNGAYRALQGPAAVDFAPTESGDLAVVLSLPSMRRGQPLSCAGLLARGREAAIVDTAPVFCGGRSPSANDYIVSACEDAIRREIECDGDTCTCSENDAIKSTFARPATLAETGIQALVWDRCGWNLQ